jgi:hypothetical protein
MRPEMASAETATVRIGDTPVRLGPWSASDLESFLHLHRAVFDSPVDQAWARWKYAAAGGGQSLGAIGHGAWAEGAMVAHCGGIPRDFHCGRVTARGLQIGDVIVAPAWRAAPGRRGAFFRVCDGLYRSQVGPQAPHALGFGFPNLRHMRLAVTLGLAHDDGPVWALHQPLRAVPQAASPLEPRPGWLLNPLLGAAQQGRWLRRGWAALRAGLTSAWVGSREAALVMRRFNARPDAGYAMWSLSPPGPWEARGVLVTRTEGPSLWLVDWIGHPGQLPVAWDAARLVAQQGGCSSLQAWASEPVWDALTPEGMPEGLQRVEAARIGRVAQSTVAVGQTPRWWLMAGDTDFL